MDVIFNQIVSTNSIDAMREPDARHGKQFRVKYIFFCQIIKSVTGVKSIILITKL